MRVVFEMALYMYLYQIKLLQMAARFTAHFYSSKFNFWNKQNCCRETLKVLRLDVGTMFVCLFVCLLFVSEIPYFAERRDLMLAPIL